jgi:hypothetical protein
MTPAQFLASEPRDHPGFVHCDDLRCGRDDKTGPVPMPNLVELLRRVGGPDAIPDHRDPETQMITDSDDPRAIAVQEDTGRGNGRLARLKDLGSGTLYAWMFRYGEALFVGGWHPREARLILSFAITGDWSVSAWGVLGATIGDASAASYDLDAASYDVTRLVAEAFDHWIGETRKATQTYVHIRCDRFVF